MNGMQSLLPRQDMPNKTHENLIDSIREDLPPEIIVRSIKIVLVVSDT